MRLRILIPRRRPKKLVARASKRSSKRSAQLTLLIFATALLGTAYALVGDSGLMAVMKMRSRAAKLRYEINAMEAANQALRDTIRPLRDRDPQAIEKLAREKLFMVRPGDQVYMLPEEVQPLVTPPPVTTPGRTEGSSPTAPSLPFRR